MKVDMDGIQPININTTSAPKASAVSSNGMNGSAFKPSGANATEVMDALSSLNIKVEGQSHTAVMTSDEHRKVVSLKGILVKNLLVTEKRIKTKCQYLIVLPADKDNIALKVIGKYWGRGGGLRAVSTPDVTFRVGKGSISPLAVKWDENNIVKVMMDSDLKDQTILVHPGSNEATVSMTSSDLETYCNHFGNTVEYMDLNPFIGDAAKETNAKLVQEAKQAQSKKKKKVKKKKDEDQKDKDQNQKPKPKPIKKGVENEGITKDKYTEFGDWYKEIVTKCELIDYTDISGCYVLRPLSYFIWEQIQGFMDAEIKKLGVSNAYFPLFVSEDALKSESTHFADFNPEVAWVTHSGDTALDKKIAVRPTSETIMYPMFARWIRSFRDLPLKLNQWCNVVRWEFSNPTPFLRTREFLWQEGHTAHATQEEADIEVRAVLDMYARTYSEMCAVPMIKGTKTKNETFPGADYSMTVEGYIPGSGRGIQGATSHCLGQNFAKMFGITFLDEKQKTKMVIQNSWGFTTRSVGVMIMNHSDNKGLVLPPKVAQIQVVIIPIYHTKKIKAEILDAKCIEIESVLKENGLRVYFDNRSGKKPGYKFNEWELKGIPLRVEVGARDIEKNSCMIARRDEREEKGDNLKKVSMPIDENFVGAVEQLLVDIHQNLYDKAVKARDANMATVTEWDAFLKEVQTGKIVFAPHCGDCTCEDLVSKESREYFANQEDLSGVGVSGKAKALCIPEEQISGDRYDLKKKPTKCFRSGKPATKWIMFGRSY